MQKARLVAITVAALVAVSAALAAAWWMSGRSRAADADPAPAADGNPGEVMIEIPSAAGPTSAARIDGIAPLDPGKVPLEAGKQDAVEPALPEHGEPHSPR